jgi:hypothetical protein
MVSNRKPLMMKVKKITLSRLNKSVAHGLKFLSLDLKEFLLYK